MKALIFVGGIDSDLNPLTMSVPKPLVEFGNKPIILHQVMMNLLKKYEAKLDIKIACSCASESLGTAGHLALARDKLIDSSGEPFFVLNSDVICEYPLSEMMDFHESHMGARLLLWSEFRKVDEIIECGDVVMDESTGQVQWFIEKPELFAVDKGNAGIYLLNPSVLDRIKLRKTYFETDVFPKMAADKSLYAMVLPGFWKKIVQTEDYITGLRLYLDHLSKNSSPKLAVRSELVDKSAKTGEGFWNVPVPDVAAMPGVRIHKQYCNENSIKRLGFSIINEIYRNRWVVSPRTEIKSNILKPEYTITGLNLYLDYLESNSCSELGVGSHIVGNVLVDEGAKTGEGCWIGPDVAIGAGCVIESHVKLSCCTVMPGVHIKKNSFIERSIIGWRSTVGQCVHVINSVFGEFVHVGDGAVVRCVEVWPDVEIQSSISKPLWV